LLGGVTVVALSAIAPMVLPMGLRALAISEAISLYGGLAVFSGFVLYEWVVVLVFCDARLTKEQYSENSAPCPHGRARSHETRSNQ
jgi:hypothetical protein